MYQGVTVIPDADQYATDLMKCVNAIRTLEQEEPGDEYSIIILGGLSGRLDQTIHTMSYLHKLRKQRRHVFVITDDNVAWVLDEVSNTVDTLLVQLNDERASMIFIWIERILVLLADCFQLEWCLPIFP